MKFAELLNLPWDLCSGKIDLAALERALPDTPRRIGVTTAGGASTFGFAVLCGTKIARQVSG